MSITIPQNTKKILFVKSKIEDEVKKQKSLKNLTLRLSFVLCTISDKSKLHLLFKNPQTLQTVYIIQYEQKKPIIKVFYYSFGATTNDHVDRNKHLLKLFYFKFLVLTTFHLPSDIWYSSQI
jgi:hypothetical protein